jgi:hypothetical protein
LVKTQNYLLLLKIVQDWALSLIKTVLRRYGFTALWHYGFTALRLYGFTALRLYGITALRQYGFKVYYLYAVTP